MIIGLSLGTYGWWSQVYPSTMLQITYNKASLEVIESCSWPSSKLYLFQRERVTVISYLWAIGTLKSEKWKLLIENVRKKRSKESEEDKSELIEIHQDILEKLFQLQ